MVIFSGVLLFRFIAFIYGVRIFVVTVICCIFLGELLTDSFFYARILDRYMTSVFITISKYFLCFILEFF